MPRFATPLDYWTNAAQVGMIFSEAQAVIAMRMLGTYGLWSVPGTEHHKMVSEKIYALTKAWTDAGVTAIAGGTPDQIAAAAIDPIRRKTRSNKRRLAKRGFKTASKRK